VKLLLDTHILLWWLTDDAALPPPARELIADPENAIFVSAVSLWEIWLKHSLGKLHLPADFDARLAAEGFESLPLAARHTREIATLPWHHRDPFDRMLVAQARCTGLQLLTADRSLVAYGDMVHALA
jgi:PIN domain nuclease of toxin-antitoxin system